MMGEVPTDIVDHKGNFKNGNHAHTIMEQKRLGSWIPDDTEEQALISLLLRNKLLYCLSYLVAGSQEHVFVTDTVVITIIPSGNRGWQFAPNPTARQGKEASFKLEFAWFQKSYSHPFGESLIHSE